MEKELKNLFAQMQQAVAAQTQEQDVESMENPVAAMETVPPGVPVG